MSSSVIGRSDLLRFVGCLDSISPAGAAVYLLGESSQLLEGWREWAGCVEIALDPSLEEGNPQDRGRFATDAARDADVSLVVEFPGDVIPLPAGWKSRCRPTALTTRRIRLMHFDPYAVSFRFLARGDEPDYHLVLDYLAHEWVEPDRLEMLADGILPRFTEEKGGQDPAEFRRRFRGLQQMWRSIRPGTTHRLSTAGGEAVP